MKKITRFYRPAPFMEESNPDHILLRKYLSRHNWKAFIFKYWRISELYKYRNKCNIIHLHFPEAFWRNKWAIIRLFKAIWFIFIFYISRLLKYKWVFSAHNVIPHYEVRSQFLERIMRFFILRKFDLVIGLAYNTKNDLELAYGFSGNKYILAIHGTYEDCYPITKTKKEFRTELNIPDDAKVILITNASARKNKGTDNLLKTISNLKNIDNIHFILIGDKLEDINQFISKPNFHFIPGKVPNNMMGSLFSSIDFLWLNYKNITTSGLFFLSVTFGIPVIAPSLPFFVMHTSKKTAILYDYNIPISIQINDIINEINEGREICIDEMNILRNRYNSFQSAKLIAEGYNSIL